MIDISDEAIQDMRALFNDMTHAQFKEFILNSIRAAGAAKLHIVKDVSLDANNQPHASFTLRFLTETTQ